MMEGKAPAAPALLLDVRCRCTVSRAAGTGGQRWQSVTERAVWLKEMEQSGNCKCVFSVVSLARLGDSNSKTDAETIRAHGRMFLLPLHFADPRAHPPTPLPAPTHLPSLLASWLHIKVGGKVLAVRFIVRQLEAVVGFYRSWATFRSWGKYRWIIGRLPHEYQYVDD